MLATVKLFLIFLLAGAPQAATIHLGYFDTLEECQAVGSEWLGREHAGGFVRGFACMNTKVD